VVQAAPQPSAPEPAKDEESFDWPVWRGPRGDGISREKDWKSTWPDAGPGQLWNQQIGIGFSSISVSSSRAFTMGWADGKDTVFCLDAAKGDVLWKHSYPCLLVDNLHEGGPAATPTVDGNRVYTVSKEGHLFCLDADKGTVVWSAELQKLLEVKMPEWGFSCSPLVRGELLLLEAGRTAAFDKRTGQLVWKTNLYRPGYGSAVAMQVAGEAAIAVLNNDCLLVVREKDGQEIAQTPWETQYVTTSTTPIPIGNTIFVSTGYRQGCALFELKGGKLEALYQNKNMANHMNNCVLFEGCLYGFSGNSHDRRRVDLVCLDAKSGEVKWKQGGLGCGSLMLADGRLIALSDEGSLVIAKATSESFQELGRAAILDGRCWTVPVLANGRIYARNAAGKLVCVDVR